MSTKRVPYTYLHTDNRDRLQRPVVVGSGPAGLFCAYYLARAGLSPLVIERGDDVDSRMKKVQSFWDGKALDTESNVQFGEGGAGTFSDGKLNTLVKDLQAETWRSSVSLWNAGHRMRSCMCRNPIWARIFW